MLMFLREEPFQSHPIIHPFCDPVPPGLANEEELGLVHALQLELLWDWHANWPFMLGRIWWGHVLNVEELYLWSGHCFIFSTLFESHTKGSLSGIPGGIVRRGQPHSATACVAATLSAEDSDDAALSTQEIGCLFATGSWPLLTNRSQRHQGKQLTIAAQECCLLC